jgi:hypothetical protein
LEAGIFRADITPPLGTRLFGYPDPERLGPRIADPLGATVLVLRGAGLRAAIISLDWCLVDEEETSRIRLGIEKATGIPRRNITVCAIHTHSAPETVDAWGWGTKNADYLRRARVKIVRAAKRALGAARPVVVGIGTGQTTVGINRREVTTEGGVVLGVNDWGPRDERVTVIRLEGATGPVAQIVHMSAHPTARGKEPSISRDWPGVMCDRIETVTGTPVLFINGAFGDVAPRMATRTSAGYGEQEAMEVGLRAGNDALAVWRQIKDFNPLDLGLHHGELSLPYAPLEPLEEAEAQLRRIEPLPHARGENGCLWRYWNAVRSAHGRPLEPSRSFPQAITRIGPIVIVPFPGEIFSEIALRLMKASPYEHTLCAGATNGSLGYFVTREARARGGYEVWAGRSYGPQLLANNIDDALVQQNLLLLTEMRTL